MEKNIQKAVNKLPVTWPITRNVVRSGVVFHPALNSGDVVKCYYCNARITVDNDSAFQVPGDEDEMVYIECPKCEKRVSALYYFDRKAIHEEAKPKKKSRRRSRYYVDDILSLDPDGEL